ncbi:cora-domain-containing protein [Heliocybe sulcata]|uniref:Cora-domain-containing protein n=1 Tax=Heliocybe sulcata TaxID=5364 RepID=A0A5C3NF99_9AGAM|nr:cora-domain-containing protein [Heliocybe sulcata]
MSSPQDSTLSTSSRLARRDTPSPVRRRTSVSATTDLMSDPARLSPTISRSMMNDPDARERQRALDADMAMQLSRARSHTVSSPMVSPVTLRPQSSPEDHPQLPHSHNSPFPALTEAEEREFTRSPSDISDAHTELPPQQTSPFQIPTPSPHLQLPDSQEQKPTPLAMPHLNQTHDPNLLATVPQLGIPPVSDEELGGLPMYQPNAMFTNNLNNVRPNNFDFEHMEAWAMDEKKTLGIDIPAAGPANLPPSFNRRPSEQADQQPEAGPSQPGTSVTSTPSTTFAFARQRKLSQSKPGPRRHRHGDAGKMALFEGAAGAPPPTLGGISIGGDGGLNPVPSLEDVAGQGHDRPYRFSFYSNALSATIHARSLSELPAEGQTFEQLFSGISDPSASGTETDESRPRTPNTSGTGGAKGDGLRRSGVGATLNSGHVVSAGGASSKTAVGGLGSVGGGDVEGSTWWLDVLNPTDEEMKMLSQVFGIHPLTSEDIQTMETREKIELFRNYYFVCFRSFEQDPYSPTYLQPLNMYVVVFREGTLSFHFRPTPHPSNVRRRIKQLKDYISVTSDWISYALIDDITDAFGPLIQSIEFEVDSIDELVLILKEAEQSDMLRRIGTCRKKVMGLLRLMGNKADVVKGLAKRCNENWRVAPTSDIGLYLSDIQDHLITMTQNLNHYEKILSRSHSNYLAQISIEMTDANNQINDVLSKLTALGTVLIPMNLVTGLWGMNVHVPGQNADGYAWFLSIIGALVAFAAVGGYSTYKLMAGR